LSLFIRTYRFRRRGIHILRCVLQIALAAYQIVHPFQRHAATNCATIIEEKKANGADFECAAMTGNAPAISAF
jgi:hypothetical protein